MLKKVKLTAVQWSLTKFWNFAGISNDVKVGLSSSKKIFFFLIQ